MDSILILGGSGFVGSVLCGKLVRSRGGGSLRITVPTRRLAKVRPVQILPTVDVVESNLFDDAQLARLVAGRDAVVNLVAILNGREADFRQVNAELPRRVAQACVAAGVARLVHVSALGAAVDAPSHYLRAKAAGELALRELHARSNVMRPSVIFGAGDRFMNLFARLQSFAPFVPLARADARFQPVWVDDVAEAIVRVLDDPEAAGQTFECAGPRVFSLAELVRLAGQWSGNERPIVRLPDAIGRLQALFMELLPGEPMLSRDNLRSMQVANVASGKWPGLATLGITASDVEAIMPSLLERGGEAERLNRWRGAVHHR